MYIQEQINMLKEHIFFTLMDLAGRVYVILHYSEDVIIGKRGFTDEEKANGLVLVFNQKMNFQWEEDAIKAKLSFGNTIEKCYIPVKNIVCIFSPDINARFIIDFVPTNQDIKDSKGNPKLKRLNPKAQGNVITVDFTNKNIK